jgi:hypothetical protein
VRDAVTPPVIAPTGAELDLDVPPLGARRRRRWFWPFAVVLTVVLVGAATGAALRTVTAGALPPTLPQAELGYVEAHLDGSTTATLRLTVHNPAESPVLVSDVVATGIAEGRISEPVRRTVEGGETAAVLFTVTADCNRSLTFTALDVQVRLADGTTVDAVPTRALASAGGLCRLMRAQLPDGWWDPWPEATARPVGDNLELTLPPLEPGRKLAGIWAGGTILDYGSPELVGTAYPAITLKPPNGCVLDQARRMPTGLKVLLTGTDGLRTRYVVVGPELARWLLRRC